MNEQSSRTRLHQKSVARFLGLMLLMSPVACSDLPRCVEPGKCRGRFRQSSARRHDPERCTWTIPVRVREPHSFSRDDVARADQFIELGAD